MDYPQVLALTVVCELAIAVALTRSWSIAGVCVLVNALTHPLASWLWTAQLATLEVLECAVLLVEACGYRLALGLSWRRAAFYSVACNSLTWALSYWL